MALVVCLFAVSMATAVLFYGRTLCYYADEMDPHSLSLKRTLPLKRRAHCSFHCIENTRPCLHSSLFRQLFLLLYTILSGGTSRNIFLSFSFLLSLD
ncbi:hypothetical protein BDF14DRAFT_99518 [Spinellus fusiger]|nr:hypothetical protein BDF14DRAFT_99518 [Spinellus fusiger]